MVRQEFLKCLESVCKSLRVVRPVNPENDLNFFGNKKKLKIDKGITFNPLNWDSGASWAI